MRKRRRKINIKKIRKQNQINKIQTLIFKKKINRMNKKTKLRIKIMKMK